MSGPSRAEEAARLLLEARRERRTLEALPESCRPRTVEEGYAVQDALVLGSGSPLAGWKLGATTPYWQKRAGLTGPMAGRLLASHLHRGSTTLPGADFHLRMVECEYAFLLGRDLPARDQPYGLDEVRAAVEAVHGCLEVADSRYARGLMVDTPSLIADNVLAGAYVVGPRIELGAAGGPTFEELTTAPVKVWVDGQLVNEGKGEHTGGHPILPLLWLANDRSRRGEGLAAGLLVSTGSCTGGFRSPPAAHIVGDYGAAGTVELTFTA